MKDVRLLLLFFIGLIAAVPQSVDASGKDNNIAFVDAQIAEARARIGDDPQAALYKLESTDLLVGLLRDPRFYKIELVTAQAQALLRLRRIDEARQAIDRALAMARLAPIPRRLLADLRLAVGQIALRQNKVEVALRNLQSAHNLYRLMGDRRSQSVALRSLASLYLQGGDQENAIAYSRNAMEVFEGDEKLRFNTYNNIGVSLLALAAQNQSVDLANQAIEQFDLAQAAASASGVDQFRVLVAANRARAMIIAGRLDDADRLAQSFLSLNKSAGASAELWHLWQVRADIALRRNQLSEASRYAERALVSVDPKTSAAIYRPIHETAYKIYRATGGQSAALTQLEAITRIDKEASELTTRTANALIGARFNSANQVARIAQLKAEQAEATAKSQRTIFGMVAIGGAILMSILAVALYLITRSRNAEREAKTGLAQTNRDLERANAAKMAFLATTSHEIRTPLNGILGMTQVLLRKADLTPTVRDRIGVIDSAGTTMRALVDDILDMAKIETGNLTVVNGVVELPILIREVAQLWRLQAESAGIALKIDVANCPARIEGDSARLRQIIFNLVSNAVKFTEKGAVCLSAFQQGDRILIQVKDTGVGIDHDWHESIFELFQQVDGGTTRRYGGTGLGLAICRSLARAMEGDIRVDSELGFGSTFTVDLPLVLVSPQLAQLPGERAGLLIFEHNPLILGTLRAVLSRRFSQIIAVATADEFENYIVHQAFEWIYCDHDSVTAFSGGLEYVAGLAHNNGAQLALVTRDVQISKFDGVTVLQKPVTKAMLLSVFDEDSSAPAHLVAA